MSRETDNSWRQEMKAVFVSEEFRSLKSLPRYDEDFNEFDEWFARANRINNRLKCLRKQRSTEDMIMQSVRNAKVIPDLYDF